MRLAMDALLTRCFFINSEIRQASTRFAAVIVTRSKMPSSLRKDFKVEPLWRFFLAIFTLRMEWVLLALPLNPQVQKPAFLALFLFRPARIIGRNIRMTSAKNAMDEKTNAATAKSAACQIAASQIP
jgi:hypothetical protein